MTMIYDMEKIQMERLKKKQRYVLPTKETREHLNDVCAILIQWCKEVG